MKTKCPNCGQMVITDENEHTPGSVVKVDCPRCRNLIDVQIPGMPVKAKYPEAEPLSQSQGAHTDEMHPDHIRLKQAELALKAKELELEERRLQQQAQQAQQPPVQQTVHQHYYTQPDSPVYYPKSKTTAGILGILLGGIGAHKFYLGKTGMGILYLLFCWTYIPSIVGLIEGIVYLTKTDAQFHNDHVAK